jgi:hypothetical protein
VSGLPVGVPYLRLDVELRLEVIPRSNFSSWRLAGGLLITETYAADLSEEPL